MLLLSVVLCLIFSSLPQISASDEDTESGHVLKQVSDCSFDDGKTFFFEDKFYRIVTEQKTWRGAQKACQKLGAGHLAEAVTEREHRFIQLILEMHDERDTYACTAHSYWIGSRQENQPSDTPNDERIFNWVNAGTPIDPAYWHPSEPNNWGGNPEKCAQYVPGYQFGTPDLGFLINDSICSTRLCFVCQD